MMRSAAQRQTIDTAPALSVPTLLLDCAWLAQKTVYLETVDGCAIYQVQDGWATALLRDTGTIACVANGYEFEDALQDPRTAGIYVLSTAALTPELARRMIKRNALGKTIFWETKANQP